MRECGLMIELCWQRNRMAVMHDRCTLCTYETDKLAFVVMSTRGEWMQGLSVTKSKAGASYCLWTMFGEFPATLSRSAKGSAAGI